MSLDIIRKKAAEREWTDYDEVARLKKLNAQQAKVIEDLMDARDEERNETLLNWLGLGLFALLVLSFGAWVASQVLLVLGG